MNSKAIHRSTRARVAFGLVAVAFAQLSVSPVRASEASSAPVASTVERVQARMRARGEVFLEASLWKATQVDLEEALCIGYEYQNLPVFGECPDQPGYVTAGIATCHQPHKIPRRLVPREIIPGIVRLVCELDYANAESTGATVCDYSQCFYIEEPEWPLP